MKPVEAQWRVDHVDKFKEYRVKIEKYKTSSLERVAPDFEMVVELSGAKRWCCKWQGRLSGELGGTEVGQVCGDVGASVCLTMGMNRRMCPLEESQKSLDQWRQDVSASVLSVWVRIGDRVGDFTWVGMVPDMGLVRDFVVNVDGDVRDMCGVGLWQSAAMLNGEVVSGARYEGEKSCGQELVYLLERW